MSDAVKNSGNGVATLPASNSRPPSVLSSKPVGKLWKILTWMPKRCRYDPDHPPVFSTGLNILFGCAGAFTVANLYYNQPILNILAESFHVSYETSSHVPTLAQSGYAIGLFFVCPLGDLVRRRFFTLGLILFTSTVWIGLCVTRSFAVFQALTFITGITTVTPQLMLPLVGDLAPPHKRARMLFIVVSGNVGGILIARILSGVVTNYINWRIIYFIALGLQYTILILLFCFMPDYPSTNPSGLPYYKLLIDVVKMPFRHPVVMQASLIGFCTSATFTSFWTTLTFFLSSAPYNYPPVIIGLFGLINILALVMSPIYARTFIEKFVPMFSAFIGQTVVLIGVVVGTFTGRFTVSGPILFALLCDAGFQIVQIANRSAIYSCEPRGRNRVNTAFMVISFFGQVTGTSAGNRLYALYGWRASGSLSLSLIVFSLFLLCLRGPYETRWVGWQGGASMRKKDKMSADGRPSEVPAVESQESEIEKGNVTRALEEAAEVEDGAQDSTKEDTDSEKGQSNHDQVTTDDGIMKA